MRRPLHRLLDAWATALAVFALGGVLKGALLGGGNWNWIWIAGPGIPSAILTLLIAAFGAGLLARRPLLVGVSRVGAALLAAEALVAGVRALLLTRGLFGVEYGFPIPESVLTAALLAVFAWSGPATWPRGARALARRGALSVAAGCVALLGHVAIVGATCHVEPAEAVVVLGARVHADGTASGALDDRVATACDVYRASERKEGLPVLVLSGGADAGASVTEPEAMSRLCRDRGIPVDRLILDEEGVNTHGTASSVARLVARHGWRSVHVVSHDYHLARLQVAFREVGVRANVVPCRETHPWPGKPLAVLRELAALSVYLLTSRG